jgi:hypothetical protein
MKRKGHILTAISPAVSNGVLAHVYHFDSKALVEDYIRTLPVPATFLLPGFYMSNFSTGDMLREAAPGSYVLALPVPPTAPVPLLDAARDTGKFAKAVVLLAADDARRPDVLGRRVLAAAAYTTPQDLVRAFRTACPGAADVRFVRLGHDEYRDALLGAGLPGFAAEELLQNMRLLDEFGYYGGEGLEESLAIVEDKLTSWEEFCKLEPKWEGLR